MILLAGIAFGLAIRLSLRPVVGRGKVHPLRGEGLLAGSFVLAVLLPLLSSLGVPEVLVYWFWILLMTLLFTLCLVNVRHEGFALLAAGVALNLLVIAANGGMPVATEALVSLGRAGHAGTLPAPDIFHLAQHSRTVLVVLGDALPLPAPPGWRAVFSVGDVVMFAGAVTVTSTMRLVGGDEL